MKHVEPSSKLRQRFEIVKSRIGADLRLNLATGFIEFRGEALNPRFFRLFLATELDLDIPAHDASAILRVLGMQSPYDPDESPSPVPEPESQPEIESPFPVRSEVGGWLNMMQAVNDLQQRMENENGR